MSRADNQKSKIASILAEAASRLPGVSESIACAGTALESKTFVVGKKSFVFIGTKDARLKLKHSLFEATELSSKPRSAIRVGTGGWVTIQLQAEVLPSVAVLRRWVKESYGLFSPPSESFT